MPPGSASFTAFTSDGILHDRYSTLSGRTHPRPRFRGGRLPAGARHGDHCVSGDDRPDRAPHRDARDASDHCARRAQRDGTTAVPGHGPAGGPNVIFILIDDMGFGQPSAFGGDVPMPTIDSLANAGLRYNRYHTTALCSPTRMAILTGRNHHNVNTGAIMELATAFTGNTGIRPLSTTTFPEILRQNGYSTAAFGKYHETPPWEVSVSGPFDRWPTHSGFDKFYGFIGGETNQYSPLLFDGTTMVEPSADPKYHVTTDLTDHGIAWMRAQHALTPDKPFFIYFAPGATHAPHQVPKEWIAKFKGKFDNGWDKYRERVLARQIKLGIVPPGTPLAPKPKAIKDWDQLSPLEKKVFAREMEVYAGFAAQTDYEIGRMLQAVNAMGAGSNTLVFYEAGDNGASAEGGDERDVQRDDHLQWRPRRRWRTSRSISTTWVARTASATTGRLGGGGGRTVRVDQADRGQLWRHPEPARGFLAGTDQGERRDPESVDVRHGHCSDGVGGRGDSRAADGERCHPAAHGRAEHRVHIR